MLEDYSQNIFSVQVNQFFACGDPQQTCQQPIVFLSYAVYNWHEKWHVNCKSDEAFILLYVISKYALAFTFSDATSSLVPLAVSQQIYFSLDIPIIEIPTHL